jgi:crotonobetainyl-CoA:carnitine CoA-transferase CaiB-like acyl-CoA transferase
MHTIDQVVADPQTAALAMIQQHSPGPAAAPLSLVGLPLSFDRVRPPFAKAAPALGENNPTPAAGGR